MDSPMEILPIEIILNIFKYLSKGDLLACDLTCRHFNNIISNEAKFWNKIKLKFVEKENISYLLASERKYVNLSLCSIKLDSFDKEIWRRLGLHLKSLSIRRCYLSFDTFAKILKCLPNLERLSLKQIDLFEYDENCCLNIKRLDCLYGFLDNVNTLNIEYGAELRDTIFSELMELMPNVAHLSIIRCQSSPNSAYDISWNCFKYWITKQANKLKTLIFYQWMWSIEEYDDLLEILDLEYLEFHACCYNSEDEVKLCNFLKSQKRLKSLKISNEQFLDTHLIAISDNIKDLEILEILECSSLTSVGISALHKFKKLKSLKLMSDSDSIILGLTKNVGELRNGKLDKLQLILNGDKTSTELYGFCVDICKIFQNLTVLNISMNDVTDGIVQTIIKNLRFLRELELQSCEHVTDYGLTGVGKSSSGLSISSLKGLQILRLSESYKITRKSFVEIVKCKELKELDVSCILYKTDPPYLNSILKNCGSLEKLQIINKTFLVNMQIIAENIPRLKNSTFL